MKNTKLLTRARIRRRIRAKISGSATKPRVCVYRSTSATYVQAIDDTTGRVLAQSSDLHSKAKEKPLVRAREIGKTIGKALLDKKITHVVFDRAGYQYHGKVKEVAEGAREAGLQF